VIDFKDMLDKDADEGVDWARRLPDGHEAGALDYFWGILGDKDQTALRRLLAASVLNALGSSHSLPLVAATQAFGAIPTLARETDQDIRRNGLAAVSSVLHSLCKVAPPASLGAFDQFLKSLAREMPGGWEKSLLAGVSVAFEKRYLRPDPFLAKLVGKEPRSRVAYKSKLWNYILSKGLFDSKASAIRSDAKLRPVLGGRARIKKSELPKYLAEHLIG